MQYNENLENGRHYSETSNEYEQIDEEELQNVLDLEQPLSNFFKRRCFIYLNFIDSSLINSKANEYVLSHLDMKMECPYCGLRLYRHNFSAHYR